MCLADQDNQGVPLSHQFLAARLKEGFFRNQRETLLQAGQAFAFLPKPGLLLLKGLFLQGQLDILVTQAQQFTTELLLLMFEFLLAGLEMPLPLGQRVFDHRSPDQQLAAQLHALLLPLLQLLQDLLQLTRGEILAALGIELGKRLVPFGLEIDAGIRRVALEDLQQVVLHLAGAQLVQPQRSGQDTLEGGRVIGMLQAEDTEILLAAQLAAAPPVDHVGKLTAAVAEDPALVRRQMAGQLRLGHQRTIR